MNVAISGCASGCVLFIWPCAVCFLGTLLILCFKIIFTITWHGASTSMGEMGIAFLSLQRSNTIKEDLIAKAICHYLCESIHGCVVCAHVSTYLLHGASPPFMCFFFFWAHSYYSVWLCCLNRLGCQTCDCLSDRYVVSLSHISAASMKDSHTSPSQTFPYA